MKNDRPDCDKGPASPSEISEVDCGVRRGGSSEIVLAEALTECLSEDAALRFVEGEATSSPEAIQNHLDVCPICRVLVGEAVLAMGHAGQKPETSPASRRRTLTTGTVILRRYEIVRFLARGGMGEVYEARDNELGEVVALKTLVATALDDTHAMGRLREEVRIARQVTHPNVCRILEFGLHQPNQASGDSIPFLTMEFLRGETLEQRLSGERHLGPTEVAGLLEQMIAGLKAIHAAGIVHRDLKPANVFVLPGPSERVVLMDFGLARAFERERGAASGSGPAVVGTFDYMAPEQVEGKPATPAFDIYALGLVVFEMLTGTKPFAAETPLASAAVRLTRRPPRPSDTVPGLHPEWDDIVARCLATDPAKRFASVDEIATHLTSIATGRRRFALRKASVLAAASLGALIALAALAARRSETSRPTALAPSAVGDTPRRTVTTRPSPARTADFASPAPALVASSTPPAGTRKKPRGESRPSSTERRDSSTTENREELFAPRPARPRHPDDVINPFEDRPL
jgi:serine/threonine protein kinase